MTITVEAPVAASDIPELADDARTDGGVLPAGWQLTVEPGRPAILRVPGPGSLDSGALRALLARHGAVMVRGLGLASPADLAAAARELGATGIPEREGFTTRRAHADQVLSSSEWPSDEPMCMHHELSYAAQVPSLALFGCLVAPDSGGATAVADAQGVLEALPPELVARFERDGWLLTRSYREVGIGWVEAFGTEEKESVAEYCARNGIDHEWAEDGDLLTRQRRAAVLRHPVTGRRIWFNQAAFLHELTLDPMIREYLEALYGPEGLPFRTAYGDGSPIPAEVVDAVNAAYASQTRREPWQDGDLLVVDNLRTAHSREPYEGNRKVVTLFAEPVRLAGHLVPPAGR